MNTLNSTAGNLRSVALVSHVTATSFRICFIKVYSRKRLNNYKLEILGYEISKSAVCKGDDPSPNAIRSLPQSHHNANVGAETAL